MKTPIPLSDAKRGTFMREYGLGSFATNGAKPEEKEQTIPDYKQLFLPATEGQYVATPIYQSVDVHPSSVIETARLAREPNYETLFGQAALAKK